MAVFFIDGLRLANWSPRLIASDSNIPFSENHNIGQDRVRSVWHNVRGHSQDAVIFNCQVTYTSNTIKIWRKLLLNVVNVIIIHFSCTQTSTCEIICCEVGSYGIIFSVIWDDIWVPQYTLIYQGTKQWIRSSLIEMSSSQQRETTSYFDQSPKIVRLIGRICFAVSLSVKFIAWYKVQFRALSQHLLQFFSYKDRYLNEQEIMKFTERSQKVNIPLIEPCTLYK